MRGIPNWQKLFLECYFCGTDKKVKYKATLKDDRKEICLCERCAYIHADDKYIIK